MLFQVPMHVVGWKMQAGVLTNKICHKNSLYRPSVVKNLTSPCCTTVQRGGAAPCTTVQVQCSTGHPAVQQNALSTIPNTRGNMFHAFSCLGQPWVGLLEVRGGAGSIPGSPVGHGAPTQHGEKKKNPTPVMACFSKILCRFLDGKCKPVC